MARVVGEAGGAAVEGLKADAGAVSPGDWARSAAAAKTLAVAVRRRTGAI